MNKLLDLIDSEINKNQNCTSFNSKELNCFEEVFQIYHSNDITSIGNLDLSLFLMANLLTYSIDMSFDELNEKVETFINAIDDDIDKIDELIHLIEKFIKENRLNDVLKQAKKYGQFLSIIEISKTNELENDVKRFILLCLNLFPDTEYSKLNIPISEKKLNNVITLFEKVGTIQPFEEMLSLIFIQDNVLQETTFEILEKFKKKDRNKALCMLIKNFDRNMYDNVFKALERMAQYHCKIINEKNKNEKKALKNIKRNRELTDFLKRLESTKPIVLTDKLLSLCTTAEIKLELLVLINKYNLKFYQNTFQINQNYKNSSFSKLEILFNKNGLDFTGLSIEKQDFLINNANIEQVSKILEFLSKDNFSFINESSPIFVDLLLYSNIDILNSINSLVNNGIITKEFIQKYPMILISKDGCACYKTDKYINYEIFMQKLLFMKENGISIHDLVSNEPEIFECSLEQLRIQLEILNEYGINILTKGFEILKDPTLLDLIDNYIELGLGEYVKNNKHLICEDNYSLINRIIISTKLGINIFNEKNYIISKIEKANKFYVLEENMEKFIINFSDKYINPKYRSILMTRDRNVISRDYSELLSILEPFKNDELTYKFNNTLISKNRILRNLEVILASEELKNEDFTTVLFQAILYKSLIVNDESEITNIYDSLSSLSIIDLNLVSKIKQIS